MPVKRMGILAACVLSLVLTIGTVGATAAGPTKDMKFLAPHLTVQWVSAGSNPSSAAAAQTVGSTAILSGRLHNLTTEFGKGPGTAVGRFLLDCTLLTTWPAGGDGLCTGIMHLPDGFFLFGGNGPFVPGTPSRYYAITGGIGPYSTARGQVIVGTSQRASVIEVKLFQ